MHAPDGTDYPNACVFPRMVVMCVFTQIETDRLVVNRLGAEIARVAR